MHQTPNAPRFWERWRFWLGTAILAGLAWRMIDYFLMYPIWGDEASLGLNILEKSYQQLTGPLEIGQVCPIAFLWLAKFILSEWGTSELVLRLVPLLAGIGALFLIWRTAKSFAGRRIALLAAALVACSLQTVRYSNDFKPYSIDLLAALGFVSLGLWAIRKPLDWRPLVGLILISIPAIGFSYPSIFVAASVGLSLLPQMLWKVNWRQRLLYTAFGLVSVGIFGIIYFTVTRGQRNATQSGMEVYWRQGFPPHNIGMIWWLVKAHLTNMMSYPMSGNKGIAFLVTPLCLVGAIRLGIKRRFAVLALLAGPFILNFAAAFVHAYPYGYEGRVEQHLVPSIALLWALGVVTCIALAIRKHKSVVKWRGSVNGACAALVIFALTCIGLDLFKHPNGPFGDPWMVRSIITSVFQNAGRNTQIVISENPYHYASEIEWNLITQKHPYRMDGQFDAARLQSGHGDLWVMNFGYTRDLKLEQRTMQTAAEQGLKLKLTNQINYYMRVGNSLYPPVWAQALHFQSD